MKILVLTDHNTHGVDESIYPLLVEMNNLAKFDLFVASRGDTRNKSFFVDFSDDGLFAKKVDCDFSYSGDGSWFDTAKPTLANDYEGVFLRLDRPLTDEQLRKIAIKWRNKKIINDPEGIIKTGSKRFLTEFPDLCPDVEVVSSVSEVLARIKQQDVVLKPVCGYSGNGIVRVSEKGISSGSEFIAHSPNYIELDDIMNNEEEYIAVNFLERVNEGDKRVVMIGKEVIGATLRLPANGSWMCNTSQGGTASFASVSAEEKAIAERIAPEMIQNGVLVYGFDTLMGAEGKRVLSEINTLNVGGFKQAEEYSGNPVVKAAATELTNAFYGIGTR